MHVELLKKISVHGKSLQFKREFFLSPFLYMKMIIWQFICFTIHSFSSLIPLTIFVMSTDLFGFHCFFFPSFIVLGYKLTLQIWL